MIEIKRTFVRSLLSLLLILITIIMISQTHSFYYSLPSWLSVMSIIIITDFNNTLFIYSYLLQFPNWFCTLDFVHTSNHIHFHYNCLDWSLLWWQPLSVSLSRIEPNCQLCGNSSAWSQILLWTWKIITHHRSSRWTSAVTNISVNWWNCHGIRYYLFDEEKKSTSFFSFSERDVIILILSFLLTEKKSLFLATYI